MREGGEMKIIRRDVESKNVSADENPPELRNFKSTHREKENPENESKSRYGMATLPLRKGEYYLCRLVKQLA